MIKKYIMLGNITKVTASRIISLFSSVLAALLIPKLLSIDGYGQYKTYTLYITYTALLHFGFVDGILLKFAGRSYEELDKRKLRGYTSFFAIMQTCIGSLMVLSALFLKDADSKFILLALGASTVFKNILTYYQFLSQATQRFSEYLSRTFVFSLLKILFIVGLYIIQRTSGEFISYKIYLVGIVLMDALALLWYVVTYRDIGFGKRIPFKVLKLDIIKLFKLGITLTIAYQVSNLVLILDRQFVKLLFSNEIYAKYSFSYNIVTLIITVISSLSVVLLPILKNIPKEKIEAYYEKTLKTVALLSGFSLICYFPFIEFVKWFLPAYGDSSVYLKIILPGLMFNCCISIVMFTFRKALDQNFIFFKISCFELLIGFVGNVAAFALFKTPESISYASLTTMVLWFLIESLNLKKSIASKPVGELVYLVLLSCVFILCATFFSNVWFGMAIYFVLYIVLSIIFHRKLLKNCKGLNRKTA
ncbi:MAG: hypothetical protein E7623_01110 [Ruminococcaceae bacterium]|nr:hypothetical protein [Oscillospiraceae bacterium]